MKTNGKHLKYFKTRVEYWLKELNLAHYDVQIIHEHLDGMLAGCSRNKEARHATIYLGINWHEHKNNPINNKNLNKYALHECLELLLFDIVEMISCRFMDAANIEPERHNIIQSLIKTIIK